MSISPARAAAFDILLRVEREDAFATDLLHSPKQARLSTIDHALATELVMGVLRWRSRLDDAIAGESSLKIGKVDEEVLIALRIAVYQLFFLERIPTSAAINESVELVKRARKRSAAAFANAVLRKVSQRATKGEAIRQSITTAENAKELAKRAAHPEWLVARWVAAFGIDVARRICASNQTIPSSTLRLRGRDADRELREAGIGLEPGVLLVAARRVISGDVTRTAAFREGRVAIQDEASQLVARLSGGGPNVLDCCAAPGGKTSILADNSPNSMVVAAELHPHRARLLRKLVGHSNVHVVIADATSMPFLSEFHAVLADVPCSGTGTLARNPEIKWRLRPDDLADLPKRQVAILRSAMLQVKRGGTVVYSTCSLEDEENADVVQTAMHGQEEFRVEDCRVALRRLRNEGELAMGDVERLTRGPYLRTLPGVLPVDGFFAAILKRAE
jgi:16S rRNA (cytosine967-C5)-methyltransferase